MQPRTGVTSERRFVSDLLVIGRFTASPESPEFETAGSVASPQFVFPRMSVWIEHEGVSPFVADPNCVTCYNGGEPYRRRAIATQGDVSDWFKLRRDVVLQAVRAVDPAAEDEAVPFRFPRMAAAPQICLAERSLFERVSSGGAVDPLEVEERVVALLVRLLRGAMPSAGKPREAGVSTAARRRELVERAKAQLGHDLDQPRSLAAIASALDCSPFHLCRVFQRDAGTTLHAYRTQLRLRHALDRLLAAPVDLTELALETGFSHHSHFTWAFRRAFGVTPSRARQLLTAERASELLQPPEQRRTRLPTPTCAIRPEVGIPD